MPYGIDDPQWEAALAEMREVLLEHARAGRTITYGDLAASVTAVRLQPRSARLAALLAATCTAEDAQGRPMLGSLVVRKDTGIPGDGYFDVAAGLGRDSSSRRAFWESEFQHVVTYWQEPDV